METQSCGMPFVCRLYLTENGHENLYEEDIAVPTPTPFLRSLFLSLLIPLSIPTLPILWMLLLFLHVVMSPPLLSFPRARKRALLAPSQITQSISSERGGGRQEEQWRQGGKQKQRGGGIRKRAWNREERKERAAGGGGGWWRGGDGGEKDLRGTELKNGAGWVNSVFEKKDRDKDSYEKDGRVLGAWREN